MCYKNINNKASKPKILFTFDNFVKDKRFILKIKLKKSKLIILNIHYWKLLKYGFQL